MMLCQNCGQLNESGQNYCRYCGTPLAQPQRQSPASQPPPKPYGWASPSSPLHNIADGGENRLEPQVVPPVGSAPTYQPPQPSAASAPTAFSGPQFDSGYRCPRCATNALPISRSKISSGGWIVFVLMLLLCFPLFFIGLLMREEERVCPNCLLKSS